MHTSKTVLSIIVPIYNAESHLCHCINSILTQSHTDFELLLVNDGSSDKSGAICDEYANKDSRIKVIHQNNAGVSEARNAGISASNGRYIGFVDSDDRIDSDMFKALILQAESDKSDIVMCDAVTVYSGGGRENDTITNIEKSCLLTHNDISPQILREIAGAAWRCIYSSELIHSNNIRFPVGIKLSEDRIFNILCMGYAKSISYIKKPYYNRYINLKSAVHRFHSDYFDSCKLAGEATRTAIELAWNNDSEYQKAYLNQFITSALCAICNYYYKTSTFSSKERREAVKAVCSNKQLQDAIRTVGGGTIEKWILNKNYTMLILYAKFANLKHGR